MAGKPIKKMTSRNGDMNVYQYDRTFGFWGKPNIVRDIAFDIRPDVYIRCRHNSEGNRDKDVEVENLRKPIVCVGGSHSWGAGVEYGLRYTEVLEELTGRQVLNLGHCSFGLDQICLVILEKSELYQPSVIIVEQYPWSVHRVLNPYMNGYTRPHFVLDANGDLKLHKTPFLAGFKVCRRIIGSFYNYRKEFMEFNSGINLKEGYDPWADPIFLYWKVAYYDYMYRLVEKILVVMKDFCRQKGIRLIFGLSAIMQQFGRESGSALIDYDLPRKRLKVLLQKYRIATVDMTKAMKESHTLSDPVIFHDGHINDKGHHIFARELAMSMDEKERFRA